MAFLALRIGVHPSSLGGYGRGGGSAATGKDMVQSISRRDRHMCRCCGLSVQYDPQLVFLDGDRGRTQPDNLATACPSCALIQGAGRFTSSAEIMPVWLPEMSQRSLNRLVASLHDYAQAVDLPVDFSRAPKYDTAQARQILKIWGGLVERRSVLEQRTGIFTIADVVDLCLAHDPVCGFCPADLSHGLRFLHRGRYYVKGCNIYPQIVARRRNPPALASSPALAA